MEANNREAAQRPVGENDPLAGTRSPASCLVLSCLTLGIYYIVWKYKLCSKLRYLSGSRKGLFTEFICFAFVPLFNIYWVYSRSRKLCASAKKRGILLADNSVMLMLMSVLCLTPIAMAMLQRELIYISEVKVEDRKPRRVWRPGYTTTLYSVADDFMIPTELDPRLLKKLSPAKALILSILTFGIYGIVWQGKLIKRIRLMSFDERPIAGELLKLIFVPFYGCYWMYTRGERLAGAAMSRGIIMRDNGMLMLILNACLFRLGALSIVQSDLNAIVDIYLQASDARSALPVMPQIPLRQPIMPKRPIDTVVRPYIPEREAHEVSERRLPDEPNVMISAKKVLPKSARTDAEVSNEPKGTAVKSEARSHEGEQPSAAKADDTVAKTEKFAEAEPPKAPQTEAPASGDAESLFDRAKQALIDAGKIDIPPVERGRETDHASPKPERPKDAPKRAERPAPPKPDQKRRPAQRPAEARPAQAPHVRQAGSAARTSPDPDAKRKRNPENAQGGQYSAYGQQGHAAAPKDKAAAPRSEEEYFRKSYSGRPISPAQPKVDYSSYYYSDDAYAASPVIGGDAEFYEPAAAAEAYSGGQYGWTEPDMDQGAEPPYYADQQQTYQDPMQYVETGQTYAQPQWYDPAAFGGQYADWQTYQTAGYAGYDQYQHGADQTVDPNYQPGAGTNGWQG